MSGMVTPQHSRERRVHGEGTLQTPRAWEWGEQPAPPLLGPATSRRPFLRPQMQSCESHFPWLHPSWVPRVMHSEGPGTCLGGGAEGWQARQGATRQLRGRAR